MMKMMMRVQIVLFLTFFWDSDEDTSTSEHGEPNLRTLSNPLEGETKAEMPPKT